MENITQYQQENNFIPYFKSFCTIFINVVTAIIKWSFIIAWKIIKWSLWIILGFYLLFCIIGEFADDCY